MASSRPVAVRRASRSERPLAGEVVLVETFRGPRLCAPEIARLIRELAKAPRRAASRVH